MADESIGGTRAAGIVLRSGSLSATLDDAGGLADLRVDGYRALDRIAATTRDAGWGTPGVYVLDQRVRIVKDGFDVRYLCRHTNALVDVMINGQYTARRGVLAATVVVESLRRQDLNRSGFVILHANELTGSHCDVETIEGPRTVSFSDEVCPHALASDVTGMTMRFAGCASLRLESTSGDLYEIEDHRNWTDAGWKTYSPPLDRPHPWTVTEGARWQNSIRLIASERRSQATSDELIQVAVGPERDSCIPEIGTTFLRGTSSGSYRSASFIGVEIDDSRPGPDRFASACDIARRTGRPIRVTLATTHERIEARTAQLARAVADGTMISSVCVVDAATHTSTDALIASLSRALFDCGFAGVSIGAGTRAYFAELNRASSRFPDAEFLQYSVCPQVHHDTEELILDTVFGQSAALRSARHLAGKREVHVGPFSWTQRLSAHDVDSPSDEEALTPRAVDDAGAYSVYLVGSVMAGLGAATLELPSPLCLQGTAGERTFNTVQLAARRRAHNVTISDSRRAFAFAFAAADGSIRVVIANRTRDPQHIEVNGQRLLFAPYEVDTLVVDSSDIERTPSWIH